MAHKVRIDVIKQHLTSEWVYEVKFLKQNKTKFTTEQVR